jgi:hypothetical protein
LTGKSDIATFSQSPSMCSSLDIPAGQTITITAYYSVTSGTMPTALIATAKIKYGSTYFFTDDSGAANTLLPVLLPGRRQWHLS